MRVAFCANMNRHQNQKLQKALIQGLKKHGDQLICHGDKEIRCFPLEDIRIIVGITDTNQRIDNVHRFVFDKGYARRKKRGGEWVYWSIKYMNDWPETRLLCDAPHDRVYTMKKLHAPQKTFHKKTITVALSSQKYCDNHGLGDATEYAKWVISQIKTTRKIKYRPKPSFSAATPIEGTIFEFNMRKGSGVLKNTLNTSHVVITHGSAIAANAVIRGVPAITLGGGIAYSVTGHTLNDLENPYRPNETKRKNWFADVGYSQYTIPEIKSGQAWEVMKIKLR